MDQPENRRKLENQAAAEAANGKRLDAVSAAGEQLIRQAMKNDQFNVPTLEKMLTDVFCDRDIFYFYSGAEMERIFENAFDRYTVDFSRLFAYANRRGKEKEIKNYITKN